MKNRFLFLPSLMLAASTVALPAQADVITFFNFNDGNYISDGGTRTSTINPGPFTDGDDVLPNGAAGTTISDPQAPTVAGNALTVFNTGGNGANQGKFVTFNVNTGNYQNLNLSFATQRIDGGAEQGFNNNKLQYSLDGSSFTDIATYAPTPTYVGSPTYSYALSAATFDNSSVTFRYLFDGGSVTNMSAANTIDNIALTGNLINATPTPEPSTWAMMFLGMGAMIIAMRRRKSEGEAKAAMASVRA